MDCGALCHIAMPNLQKLFLHLINLIENWGYIHVLLEASLKVQLPH